MHSSQKVTIVFIAGRPNGSGPCRYGPIESGIRIANDHDHPHGTTAQRLRAEIQVLRRLVGDPKFGVAPFRTESIGATVAF